MYRNRSAIFVLTLLVGFLSTAVTNICVAHASQAAPQTMAEHDMAPGEMPCHEAPPPCHGDTPDAGHCDTHADACMVEVSTETAPPAFQSATPVAFSELIVDVGPELDLNPRLGFLTTLIRPVAFGPPQVTIDVLRV